MLCKSNDFKIEQAKLRIQILSKTSYNLDIYIEKKKSLIAI